MQPVDSPTILADADPHQRLTGVHPDLIGKVEQILVAMAVLGWPMIVTAGVRTDAEQAALYAQGRTAPGSIVTEDDGSGKRSKHQIHEDGVGHAVDCAFRVANQPSWDPHLPWTLYGAIAMKLGLKWGGSWAGLVDLPHVEI
jgi:hypothetical protein